jgi:hypothetical protein
MAGRLAHDVAGIGIGQDEPGVGRQNVRWKIGRDGKQQRIAIVAVLRPFLVGAKVGNARLDFNDPNLSVAPDSKNVGAPAVGERYFAQAFKVQRSQQALGAAQDSGGALQVLFGRCRGETIR